MTWWEAIILGLLQGLTEFLPVSSSGHLVLGQHLLGVEAPGITFEVFTHFGTALAIVTVYRQRLAEVLIDAWAGFRKPGLWVEAIRPGRIEREHGADVPDAEKVTSLRLVLYVLITIIPLALMYLLLRGWIELVFESPRLVAVMLLVTGTLLLLLLLRRNPTGSLTPLKAFVVGIAQGSAMIPGISRSGATICAGIYQNVDRKEAADFAFIMLLPAIIGATLIELLDLFETDVAIEWVPLLIGTVVAYAAGVWAIRVVLAFVQRGNLFYFAFYCYAVGVLGLIFL